MVGSNQDLLRRIEEIFRVTNERWFGGKIAIPLFRLSQRMTRAAGAARYGPWEMVISVPYHEIYGWDSELENTVKHESIHFYLKTIRQPPGHTPQFKSIARGMACANHAKMMPSRSFRYLYACPACGREFPRRRRLRNVSCGHCGRGRYNPKFRLVLRRTIQKKP
jgi:predicted SprT family Zn-dependent metalloprotease